jgi:radical SAM enzyme (TIGR01210 family)
VSPVLRDLKLDILAVMRSIRSVTRPLNPGPPDSAKGSEIWEGNLGGKPAKRAIIYLRSSGCAWAIRRGRDELAFLAGCLDCEHSVADTTYGVPISAKLYIKQFMAEYQKHDFQDIPILCVYNEGNFFNEEELPAEARREILRVIGADRGIRRLILESLPEYITEEVLLDTKRLLGAVELEVGIGLESADPNVRALCVNKSYSLAIFQSVSARVRKHCRLLTYVLVKPSFLTEREALDDSIRAVRFAFETGTDAVSIEPVSIGTYTMAGVLNRVGLYRPAWLWTVLEVAKAGYPLGEIRIGGYQFAPSYAQHARNCDICTPRIKDRVKHFNATHQFADLVGESCGCLTEWRDELTRVYPPLEERIATALVIIRKYLGQGGALSVLNRR